MTLKGFLCETLDCCDFYKLGVESLTINLAKKSNELDACMKARQKFRDAILKLEKEKTNLLERLEELNCQPHTPVIPKKIQEKINEAYSKYPESDITYSGRYIGIANEKTYAFDVKEFAWNGQANFKLQAFVNQKHAYVWQILDEQPTLSFWEACDIALARICVSAPSKYKLDKDNVYKAPEFWAFAIETYIIKYADCDDNGIFRYVLARITGIPAGLLRLTAGTTRTGFGHLTMHYLASDLKWRHANSTTTFRFSTRFKTALDFKLKDDETDGIGIGNVWFSFNEEKAFHKFITSTSRKEFILDKKLTKFIKIKPRRALSV